MHRSRMQIQLCLQNDILNQVICSMRFLNAAADKKSQAVAILFQKPSPRSDDSEADIVINNSCERF